MPLPIVHPQSPPNFSCTPTTPLEPVNPAHRHGPLALELRDTLAAILRAHNITRGPHLGLYYYAADRSNLLCVVEMPIEAIEAGRWRDIDGTVRGLLEEWGLWGPPRNVGLRYYGSDGTARERGVVVQASATSVSQHRIRLSRRAQQRDEEQCDDELRRSSLSSIAMERITQQQTSLSGHVSSGPVDDNSIPSWSGHETSNDLWNPNHHQLDFNHYRPYSRSRPQRRAIPESIPDNQTRLDVRERTRMIQTRPSGTPWERQAS
ncbi:hypothetical protein M433DRAFT_137577 [Acidomyces richmondensis BFW]|nr:MAG: hypothetical protein FE78DRAFT_67212 [Acidomyces sp. 'richmondensis']KYG42022.1 hypothetical protein M433DRAFT_137577 [Acidomyces richmondensis BFW]